MTALYVCRSIDYFFWIHGQNPGRQGLITQITAIHQTKENL